MNNTNHQINLQKQSFAIEDSMVEIVICGEEQNDVVGGVFVRDCQQNDQLEKQIQEGTLSQHKVIFVNDSALGQPHFSILRKICNSQCVQFFAHTIWDYRESRCVYLFITCMFLVFLFFFGLCLYFLIMGPRKA